MIDMDGGALTEGRKAMDEAGIKSTRRLLRVVSDHLRLTCRDRGARIEALDLVDVIFHPTNPTPTLNIVTPRRSTAWVAAGYIQPGLARLRELGRPARVQYIAGLYPPQFAVVLRDLGLSIEHETPLMVWELPETEETADEPETLPPGGRVERVDDSEGSTSRRLWDHVWRSMYYDVYTLGFDAMPDADAPTPSDTQIDSSAAHEAGIQPGFRAVHDFIYWHHHQPIGAARLILRPDLGSAHLEALTLGDTALRDTGTFAAVAAVGAETDEKAVNESEKASSTPSVIPSTSGASVTETSDDPPTSPKPPENDDEARIDILCALIQAAMRDARDADCNIVFVPADNDDERRASRRLGFVDLSSIVRYAAPSRWEGERHVAKAVFSQQK